jgi:hypothetical protein
MNEWLKLSGINESLESDLITFAGKRYQGAKKIVDMAEKKGGSALLTRDHFVVKLPYYEKAKEGKFDRVEMKKEYQELCIRLHSKMNSIEKVDQTEFQKLLGKMEVIGELLIKTQDLNTQGAG